MLRDPRAYLNDILEAAAAITAATAGLDEGTYRSGLSAGWNCPLVSRCCCGA